MGEHPEGKDFPRYASHVPGVALDPLHQPQLERNQSRARAHDLDDGSLLESLYSATLQFKRAKLCGGAVGDYGEGRMIVSHAVFIVH